jgi:ATP-dependent exoDNAse (exonuclease V) beta subunit
METALCAGPQELLYRYAAKKAVQDLRNRAEIDIDLIPCFAAFPLINYCRSEIRDEDKELLKEISSSTDTSLILRQFALSLMRQLKDHSDIKDYLYSLWKTSGEYEIKIEALWSLLIYPDLSKELYDDILQNFSVAEWDKWLPLIVEKLGGEDKEKVQVKELMSGFFNP